MTVLRVFVLAFLALTVPAGAISIVQSPATQPVIGGEGDSHKALIPSLSPEIGDFGFHWRLADPHESCRCHVYSRWRENSGGPALVDGEPEAGSGSAPIRQAEIRDCLAWLDRDDDEIHRRAFVRDACACVGEPTSHPVADRVLRTTDTWDRSGKWPILPFWWERGVLFGPPWLHEDWYREAWDRRGCGTPDAPGGGIASLGPHSGVGMGGFIGGLSGGGSGGGGFSAGGSGTPSGGLIDLDYPPTVLAPTPVPLPAAGLLLSTLLAAVGIFGWIRRRCVAP